MKTFTRMMMCGLATLALAGTVGAAEVSRNDAVALEDSRNAVAWQAQNTRGVEKQQLKDEERRLQGLIDDLQRGGQVDAHEIDRTLNRTR